MRKANEVAASPSIFGTPPTFLEPGAVGIWSKADSVTEFEAFEYGGK